MMKLSTQTDLLDKLLGSEEDAVRAIAQAGFDCVDLSCFDMLDPTSPKNSDSYRAYAAALKAAAEEAGVTFNQAHAPFPSSKGAEPYDSQMFGRIVRSMEIAALIGAKTIVVHPVQHLSYAEHVKELKQMNLDFYNRLLPYCKQFGIQIAVENMWQKDKNRNVIIDSVCARPEEFCDLLDKLDKTWFVACLDIGHAYLTSKDVPAMIRTLGHDRLHALHVHETNLLEDLHTIPFSTGKQDWAAVCIALADIHYDGEFTFEANHFFRPYPPAFCPTALRFLHDTGRFLTNMMEEQPSVN